MAKLNVDNSKSVYHLFGAYGPKETYPFDHCFILRVSDNESDVFDYIQSTDENETLTVVQDFV